MIPLNPFSMPAAGAKFTSGNKVTQTWYYLMHSVFQRTGGNSGIPITVNPTSSAAQSNLLTDDWHYVSNASTSRMLQKLQPGQVQFVQNNDPVNTLTVLPNGQGQINSLGNGIGYQLAPGKSQYFQASSLLTNGETQYHTVSLG